MKSLTYLVISLSLCLWSCSEEPKITTRSSVALEAYNQGMQAFNKFYYAEAKEAFERAVKADSNFAMAFARLAVVHGRSGNEAEARADIATAMQKLENAGKREKLYIRLFDHYVNYRFPAAALVADSLIAQYPEEAEAYVMRGNLFEVTKNSDASLAMYEKAFKADPNYALAMMSLGYAYSGRGDFDKAIQSMERYISLVPDAADPRASFADVLLRAGKYDEALAQYEASLRLTPDYWYSINRIGDVYFMLGRLDDAEKQFELGAEKMVMNDHLRASLLATKGGLELFRGNYENTLDLCRQSLSVDSVNARAAFISVRALIKLKRFEDATGMVDAIHGELVRRNLTESKAMQEFHLLRARLLREQGLLDEAFVECDSAFEYSNELSRADVHHEIAEIFLKQGEYDRALGALEGALRHNPNDPSALMTLVKTYKADGDRQMTNEIGGRLYELWKNADKDFQPLIELKALVGRRPARVATS